jgi:hypothetical protein
MNVISALQLGFPVFSWGVPLWSIQQCGWLQLLCRITFQQELCVFFLCGLKLFWVAYWAWGGDRVVYIATGCGPDNLGVGFDFRWGHWISILSNPSSHTTALGLTRHLTEINTKNLPGDRSGGRRWQPRRHLWTDWLETESLYVPQPYILSSLLFSSYLKVHLFSWFIVQHSSTI